jgi:hypothetical protein
LKEKLKEKKMKRVFGVTILLSALLFIPSFAQAQELPLSLCAPDRNVFSLNINNSFFPLPVGQVWVLTGKEQGQNIGLQITVLRKRETLYKNTAQPITTRVVEEREWADDNGDGLIQASEEMIEVSLNYFAQTQDGTVCYFGEAVDIFENGQVVSHEGSWRADDPGNAPGIFMPANPAIGMSFQQESAPGIAEDRAEIIGSGTQKVPAGTFTETLKIRDFNPLDGSKGIKWYAKNVGIIIDGPLQLVSY